MINAINGDDYLGDAIIISKGNSLSREDWVLDSGSTHHVCSNIYSFDLLQCKIKGYMTLHNGKNYDVKGMGTVMIKMFDDVKRTLDGVAYIREVCKNLISISQLDSKGYRVSAEGGVMKVARDYITLVRV